MRRLILILLAQAIGMTSLGIIRDAPAMGEGASSMGVYSGPGYVAQHDAFAEWIPAPVPYAIEFMESRYGWDEMLHPWVLDTWAPWVKAASGRRLALSVPLLPTEAKGQLAAGAAGSFDPYFRTLAQNLVNRGLGTSIIRLGWEANGSWFPWSAVPDPASWRAFYRRTVVAMRAVPGAAFTFDLTLNPGQSLSFADLYPGDDVVDVIGLDVYDVMWQDSTSTPEQRWSFLLNQPNGLIDHRDFAAARGKPLSFPEWGLYAAGDVYGGGGDNPYFIDRMADWFAANNVAYQGYFNWSASKLSNFPNGMVRFQSRFSADTPVVSPTSSSSTSTTTTVKKRCFNNRRACR